MPKASFRVHVLIHSSPEIIFPHIADLTRHGEWSANPVQVEAVTNGPIAVGSRYRSTAQVNGLHFSAMLEVTQRQPPFMFSFSGTDETGYFEHSFTLRPTTNGTVVERRVSFDLTLRQWLRYALLLYPVRLPAAIKALSLLKMHVEQPAP